MSQSQPGETGAQPRKAGNGSPLSDSSANQHAAKQHQGTASQSDPIAMLTADHRRVEKLFADFEKARSAPQKSQLAKEACRELMVHTLLEEEIFYPACQGRVDKHLLDEAQVEHDGIKPLIVEIENGLPGDEYFDAKLKVLSEDVKQHVREEEKPAEGILAKAKESGVANPLLGERLAIRREVISQVVALAPFSQNSKT